MQYSCHSRASGNPKASPQAGIYKTTDGFETFIALTNGLPDFSLGECERIGLTVCASQPNVIYAVLNMCGAWVIDLLPVREAAK